MINTKKAIFAYMLVLSLTAGSVASAATDNRKAGTSVSEQPTSAPAETNRMNKRIGAYLGILGDPHPTVVGVNLAYNVASFMRASLGFGKVSASTISISDSGIGTEEVSMTTIGASAKFMVPTWNLTPTASLGYSHVSLGDNTSFVDYKASNLYTGLGIDWQAESGFNLGAGMNLSLNSGAPSAPYINVGVFF